MKASANQAILDKRQQSPLKKVGNTNISEGTFPSFLDSKGEGGEIKYFKILPNLQDSVNVTLR